MVQEYDRGVLLPMWIKVAKYLNPNMIVVILAQDALVVVDFLLKLASLVRRPQKFGGFKVELVSYNPCNKKCRCAILGMVEGKQRQIPNYTIPCLTSFWNARMSNQDGESIYFGWGFLCFVHVQVGH